MSEINELLQECCVGAGGRVSNGKSDIEFKFSNNVYLYLDPLLEQY